jgi:GTP pyrophosphokinase
MNTIKWELEDLAFATLYPKRYDEIVRLVAERRPSRDTYLAEVTSAVTEQLKAARSRRSSPAGPSTTTRSTRR